MITTFFFIQPCKLRMAVTMNVFKSYHVIRLCMKNNLEAFKCMQLCVHLKAKLLFHRFLQKKKTRSIDFKSEHNLKFNFFFLELSKWALFTLDFLCWCCCSCRYAICTLIYKYQFYYLILLLNHITCTRISSFHCLFVIQNNFDIAHKDCFNVFCKAVCRCKQILSRSRQ